MAPLREDIWIEHVRNTPATGRLNLSVENGDDAAAWSPSAGCEIVASVDAQVEGTHFRREWVSFEDLGWRSIHSSASDLAAMGATPR
ncbi:MAG: AIR synthase related protein, partial [Planctomycetota bacterium]